MVPSSKQAEHEELVARIHAGESFAGHQTVRRRKDGSLFEVMMAAAGAGRGRAGAGHLVVYNDISVVKEQEARLQALIDSSPLALVEFGLDTRCGCGTRRPSASSAGRARRSSASAVSPWRPRRGAPRARSCSRVRAGESVNDFETVRQRKDGALVDVSIASAPIRDGTGRVVGNMVAYTDISERKAQEARSTG